MHEQPHVCDKEVGNNIIAGDPVEVVPEHFEFLPEGLEVVEWDLDGGSGRLCGEHPSFPRYGWIKGGEEERVG